MILIRQQVRPPLKHLVSRTRLVMGLRLIVAIPIFIGLANKAVRKKREGNPAEFRSIGVTPWPELHISWRCRSMLRTAASLLVNRWNVKAPKPRLSGLKVFGKCWAHTDAVAFSRTGDPATGDFRDATVLRKFGDLPDDLSAL
jgi:hypothetical protein